MWVLKEQGAAFDHHEGPVSEAGLRVDGGFIDGPHVDPFVVVDGAAHDARSHRTSRTGDHHHGVLVRVVLEATSGIHAPTMPS